MKARIFDVNDTKEAGIMIFVLGAIRHSKKTHFGTVRVNESDEVVAIYIERPNETTCSVSEKLNIIKDWCKTEGYEITDSTAYAVKIKKFNKETKKHDRTLIDISEYN